jgi:hypothetical protein
MASFPGFYVWLLGSSNATIAKIGSGSQTIAVPGTDHVLGNEATAETFTVGTLTFTYGGLATIGGNAGFYGIQQGTGKTFFFSQTDTSFAQKATLTPDTPGAGGARFLLCFMPGTLIGTPEGQQPVETLAIGDQVLTNEGVAKRITWIGRQTVSRLFADPLTVLPIRIRAGALGENLPVRDLLLSPGHAVLVDGVLVQAGALVNDLSIVRETDTAAVFTYFHVELEDHALLLAEGAAAESFIDNAGRMAFDNWAEHAALYPDGMVIRELELPRAKAHRQVPQAVRERLMARARKHFGTELIAA